MVELLVQTTHGVIARMRIDLFSGPDRYRIAEPDIRRSSADTRVRSILAQC